MQISGSPVAARRPAGAGARAAAPDPVRSAGCSPGLLLTAAVAFAVQSSQTLTTFAGWAYRSWLLIGRSASSRSAIGVQRRSAGSRRRSALGLFFVYAASLGVTVGADRQLLHGRVGRHVVLRRVGDVRRGGDLRRDDEARSLGEHRRVPVHGPDRDPRRVARELRSCSSSGDRLGDRRSIGVVIFTASDRVRRPEDQLRRLRGGARARWRRRRSSGRSTSTSTSSTSSCSCSGSSAAAARSAARGR